MRRTACCVCICVDIFIFNFEAKFRIKLKTYVHLDMGFPSSPQTGHDFVFCTYMFHGAGRAKHPHTEHAGWLGI